MASTIFTIFMPADWDSGVAVAMEKDKYDEIGRFSLRKGRDAGSKDMVGKGNDRVDMPS